MPQYQPSLDLGNPSNSSIRTPGANPFTDPRLPMVADLLERLRTDGGFTPARRADQRSCLRTFAKAMGQDPAVMPACASVYRPRLRRLTPVSTGLSAKRLSNMRSGVLHCLRRYGVVRRNARGPIGEAWQPLMARLTVHERAQLSRFSSWCSALGIAPAEVDDAIIARFRQALEEESFVRHPAERVMATCRAWNKARASWPELALPPLTIPRYRKIYVLRPATFPASFAADLDAFCANLAGTDLFAEDGPPRPLKPVSVERRRCQVMQLASGAVHKGVAPAAISSLADLIQPSVLRPALSFFVERAGGTTTTQISSLGYVARVIARHWAQLDSQAAKPIVTLTGKVDMRQRGLTAKNRERLRQFDDRELLRRLLFFPEQRLAELRVRDDGGTRCALDAQITAAVALLIVAPIRLANLAALRFGTHLLTSRSGLEGVWHLVLAQRETKNREPREHLVAAEAVAILREYIEQYRPRLTAPGNDHLFRSGLTGHKASNSLGTAISEHLRRHAAL